MTTLELASLLDSLASLLRAMPETQLGNSTRNIQRAIEATGSKRASKKSIAIPRLESLDKRELERFIVANKLPISFRKKDSTNELMRRVSRYLEQNKEARKALRNRIVHTPSKTSPRLMQAFSYLLQDKYE